MQIKYIWMFGMCVFKYFCKTVPSSIFALILQLLFIHHKLNRKRNKECFWWLFILSEIRIKIWTKCSMYWAYGTVAALWNFKNSLFCAECCYSLEIVSIFQLVNSRKFFPESRFFFASCFNCFDFFLFEFKNLVQHQRH